MPKKNRLRVIHAITAFTYGGAQRLLIDWIATCPAWVSHEVVTLYPGPMAAELRARGVKVHEENLTGAASLMAIPRWLRLFRARRPHIVHTHLGKADFCARAAARLAGVPAVVTTSHNVEHWKRNHALNLLDNMSLRSAHGILAVSGRVKQFLVERGVPEDKITVSMARVELRYRFDSPELDVATEHRLRAELGIGADTLVSLMVGRLYDQKAHDVALKALALIDTKARPHVLLMAGDGPLRPDLEALAGRTLPAASYRFLGNRGDVPDLLRLADVFVMPSRWEGAPIALSESYAAALPSVISDIPSMDEVATACHGSLVARVDDPAAIAAQWGRLLNDEKMRVTMGTTARANALEKLDIRQMRDEYLRCYADVLTTRMAPNPLPGRLGDYL